MRRSLSRRALLTSGALAALGGLATACAPVQTAYKPSGQGIVDVVIPYSAGGGTDTWGRFITPYFAELQQEVSRYQIENLPGGESITGTNAYVHASVTDGRQLLVASATPYFQSMLGQEPAEFDFAGMEPLALNGTGAVLWTHSDSGIGTAADLLDRAKPAKFGGMSATGLDLVPLLALSALEAPVKGVFGFEGRGPTRLAVQRHETDLDFQTTSTYLSQVQPMVDAGDAVPLFTIGVLEDGEVHRDPNLPDIPTFMEVYEELHGPAGEDDVALEAYRAFVAPGFYFQKGLWANAGTDDGVVELYDSMIRELNADSGFQEETESALGGYELVSGLEARQSFRDALDIDPEVLHFTQEFLTREYDAVLH